MTKIRVLVTLLLCFLSSVAQNEPTQFCYFQTLTNIPSKSILCSFQPNSWGMWLWSTIWIKLLIISCIIILIIAFFYYRTYQIRATNATLKKQVKNQNQELLLQAKHLQQTLDDLNKKNDKIYSANEKLNESSKKNEILIRNIEQNHGSNDADLISNPINFDITFFKEKTILFVDDNELLRNTFSLMLGNVSNFHEAENGEIGYNKAIEIEPDIIVSDVNMPILNGIEMCKKLKSNIQTSHIPIIILSAEISDKAQFNGYSAGAVTYLLKPCSNNQLFFAMANIIQLQISNRSKFIKSNSLVPNEFIENNLDKEFIQNITKIIEANIALQDLDPEFLIEKLGVSRSFLYTKIKNITDLGVSEFIRLVRLKKSIELLKQGELNISEIAYETGFTSISYYTRSFKKQFGETPSKYLKD